MGENQKYNKLGDEFRRFIGFIMTKEETVCVLNEILNEKSLETFVQINTQNNHELLTQEINKIAKMVLGREINTFLVDSKDNLLVDNVYFDMNTRHFYDNENIVELLNMGSVF